jgi:YfiH family protein
VEEWILPHWPLRDVVGALTTTREGGVSKGPYAAFNLAAHVGDENDSVTENRRRLGCAIDCDAIQWLEQIHGIDCIHAGSDTLAHVPVADAMWTDEPGIALAVLTADCLPVVIAERGGRAVALAHAGWRGLLAGVLQQAITAFPYAARRCVAWIGPAIGQNVYEVGEDVASIVRQKLPVAAATTAILRASEPPGKYQLDLSGLARQQLESVGVREVYCAETCTFRTSQLYSYRRDGVTGRMATVAWIPKTG